MNSTFEFTPENQKNFSQILKKYPSKRAAMLPTLHLAQTQLGYISPEVEEFVAEKLQVPVVDVREVLSFYSLFFQKAMGRHHVRLCMSLSCWLRGSEEIKQYLRERLGISGGDVTEDGQLSWEAVPDCLGACELAPMAQVDGYFEGHLTRERIDEIFDQIRG